MKIPAPESGIWFGWVAMSIWPHLPAFLHDMVRRDFFCWSRYASGTCI